MSEKVINYTPEAIERLHEVYEVDADELSRKAQIVQLAVELNKSQASIRSKLTHEGIYVPLAKAPAGKAAVRKAVLVQKIADEIGMDVDAAGSLEKATKVVLQRLVDALS